MRSKSPCAVRYPPRLAGRGGEGSGKLKPEVAEKDKGKRIDLRQVPFSVTIDGEDARDFDDAVYAEAKRGGGWRLFVAIADVSHYVKVGSALDEESGQARQLGVFPSG